MGNALSSVRIFDVIRVVQVFNEKRFTNYLTINITYILIIQKSDNIRLYYFAIKLL